MAEPALPARSFGAHAILETLETRAFSVTYRAAQPEVGRTVRVKALKPTVSIDSAFAEDLEREAAVLGRLDHEGVIRLHDLLREGGGLWLVLEDPRGPTLAEVLRGAQLGADQALGVALLATRALGHAHARGVVHRALSPEVITVTAEGRVLVTDFSSAALADDPREARAERPIAPTYMAPEQILGEPAGPRSDVWSLGVMIHEMIAGARPFDAEDPRLLASRIRGEPPAPLPDRTPVAVARLVTRCLAKDPDDRFADARALALALEEALGPITRAPPAVLATRALAAARLGEALPAPGEGAPAPRDTPLGPDLRRAARSLLLVSALVVAGGAALRALAASGEDAPGDGVPEASLPPAGARDRGQLRVVARPWAEVFLDGQLVDTTPIGKPIAVTPGKHFVTFRHPRAPDEQRTIKIAAGQTVFLDVSMRVDRGDAGAPRDAGPVTPPSP